MSGTPPPDRADVEGRVLEHHNDLVATLEASCGACGASKRVRAWRDGDSALAIQAIAPTTSNFPCPHWRDLDECLNRLAEELLAPTPAVLEAITRLEDWVGERIAELDAQPGYDGMAIADLQRRFAASWEAWTLAYPVAVERPEAP